jgi:hypothetical protein
VDVKRMGIRSLGGLGKVRNTASVHSGAELIRRCWCNFLARRLVFPEIEDGLSWRKMKEIEAVEGKFK